MTVVLIIGLFIALAAPSLARIFDDRRAANITDDISGMFRVARTRSSSTGGAHAVRVTVAGTGLKFELMQAIDPSTGALSTKSPVPSCMSPSWAKGSPDVQLLQTIDPSNDPTLVSKGIYAVPGPTGTSVGVFCFTPGGSTWWLDGTGGGAWRRPSVSDNLFFEVVRFDSLGRQLGVTREVHVGTSGIPHVEVHG